MVVGRIVKFCRLLWKLRLEYEVLYAFDGKRLQFWRRVKMFCSCLLTKDGDNEMLNEFKKLCAVQGFYPLSDDMQFYDCTKLWNNFYDYGR